MFIASPIGGFCLSRRGLASSCRVFGVLPAKQAPLLLVYLQGECTRGMAAHFCNQCLHFGRHLVEGRDRASITCRKNDGRRSHGKSKVR